MHRLQHAVDSSVEMKKRRERKARFLAKLAGSVIYFVQAGKYIKVGISTKESIKGRLVAFQTSNPHPIKLLKVLHTDSPRADEAMFHRLLKDYHVKGEWFLIDNAAILELLGVKD